jgi:ADP-heptose:LPS heptosyltransferase
MPKIKHIVVIRLSAMGDVAMIPNVSFFGVDLKERHKGFLGLLRLVSDLKKLSITHVADLHNVLRSKIVRSLFALSGKKVAATDKGRADKKALIRAENKIFEPTKSMFDRHVETFNKLGFQIDIANPKFPEKALLSNDIFSKIGEVSGMKLIGIAPFAQYESKVYPLDLMQEVINELAKKPNQKILLFGGGETEIQKLNEFQNNHENVIVVAGKLSFSEELQLISNLEVMLSMDSGNSHIAAMLGVKVVTLWGATHPYAGFKPFNQPFENCLTSNRTKYPLLPTSVYGNKIVPGYKDVMRTISVEKVTTHL